MTSTPVKDVGSVLSSLGTAIGNSAKAAAGTGFQTVLSGQAGKEPADSPADKSQTTVKKTPGESLKAKDAHLARMERQKSAGSAPTEADEAVEIPADKLEEIMTVLETAAVDMMQEIADTFGISVEELQSVMQELGMKPFDVLDQGKLGELLLKAAGVEDSYALVTDGELYDSYQELMAKLETLLQETGEELNMEPVELEEVIPQFREKTEVPEEEIIPAEVLTQDQDEVQVQTQKPEQTQQDPVVEVSSQTTAETETVLTAGQETGDETRSGQHEERSDRGRHDSLFAQDVRTPFQTQFEPQVQQTQAPSEAWSTDTQDIMRQIMDYMRIQVRPDASNLEMQLHPESLGTLQIHLASRGGVVTANFIAQNEAVKAALESQMVQLKENFEQQGVKVEAIEVTVQSHAFERNLDQGRGQSGTQEQNPRKTRTRRINLNDTSAVESLEEEDALAAEMMAVNGSQVDYTA